MWHAPKLTEAGLILALAMLSLACVEPLEPCTECPDVAGTNHPQLCDEVYYRGEPDLVLMEQSGSALRLSGYLVMEGTLYTNDTLTEP